MSHGLARNVVNDLGIDVPGTPEYGQAWSLWCSRDPLTDAQYPTLSADYLHRHGSLASGLRCLARLFADLLSLIAHALAPIRLRRAKVTNFRGGLAHHLFVGTTQD